MFAQSFVMASQLKNPPSQNGIGAKDIYQGAGLAGIALGAYADYRAAKTEGFNQSAAYQLQAEEARVKMESERGDAIRRSNDIIEQSLQIQAAQNIAYAANGGEVGSATANASVNALIEQMQSNNNRQNFASSTEQLIHSREALANEARAKHAYKLGRARARSALIGGLFKFGMEAGKAVAGGVGG